jgi:hypothetical protein
VEFYIFVFDIKMLINKFNSSKTLTTESHPLDHWKHHHHTEPGDPVMGHTEPLKNGKGTCIEAVEKWHEWLFRIPGPIHPNLVPPSSSYKAESGGYQNPVPVEGNVVTMTTFVPLKKKEDNVITLQIYEDIPHILLGVMTAEASTEEYPSKKSESELWDMVKKETDSVKEIEFKVDDVERVGCFVERPNRLQISNVANENLMGIKPDYMKPNNTVEIVYSGFWALLDVERLGAGDHLITVEATGPTYFIGATIALNILI